MADLTEFFEYWRSRIEKDLIPFADPGTRLDVSGDKRLLAAHWVARGSAEEAVFSLSLENGVSTEGAGVSVSRKKKA